MRRIILPPANSQQSEHNKLVIEIDDHLKSLRGKAAGIFSEQSHGRILRVLRQIEAGLRRLDHEVDG